MHHFIYDGTFHGLLTTIFQIYALQVQPTSIETIFETKPTLFGHSYEVKNDEVKAQRVLRGLTNKGGSMVTSSIHKVFLSEQPGREMLIYYYVQKVLEFGLGVDENFGEDCVLEVRQICKQVDREVHRMHAFTRFQKTADGVFFATIEPDFNVLPLLADHFERRYADQPWIIYDSKRKRALYYNLVEVEEVEFAETPVGRDGNVPAHLREQREDQFKTLWQDYFESVNISERKNTRLHLRHVPKRYWKYLSEKHTPVSRVA